MSYWNDLRYVVRTLRRSPGFSAATALTLALGIGATTAIFTVCDAMLWKPVALPSIERLVAVARADVNDPHAFNYSAPADLADVRKESQSIQGLTWWTDGLANVVGSNGQAERVHQFLVASNFFDVIGVQAPLGRGFREGEDDPGNEHVVVLSDGIWKRQFGADPSVIGKSIRFDDEDFLVVGVMPASFDFPKTAQVWTPYALSPQDRHARGRDMMMGMARLRPGVSMEQARAELGAISARLERDYPATNKNRRFLVLSAHEFVVGAFNKEYTLMLLGAALFVLLIACANVANLHFARATGRTREIAVRMALGASRLRLAGHLIGESMATALLGAGLGLIIGNWGIGLIRAGMPAEVAKYLVGWQEIALDRRALLFTLVAAVTAGLLAALVPAVQFSRRNIGDPLRSGSRGSAGRERLRLRSFLVAAQLALAVILLAGASLMTRGFRTLLDTAAPLDPSTMLTMRLALTAKKYQQPHERAAYYREVLARAAAVPGVKASLAATSLPFTQHSSGRGFDIEGKVLDPGLVPTAGYQAVNAEYFSGLHVPLLSGRLLAAGDGAGAPLVAVINDRMARRWWPNEPAPLGKRIRVRTPAGNESWMTIVGVVGNVPHSSYDRGPRPNVYVPFEQKPQLWMDIGVRTAGDPLPLAGSIIAAVRSVDTEQPVSDVATLDTLRHNDAVGLIYVSSLMGVFGVLALVLSSIGVYGVMSYVVTERTSEIGIRMALGAERRSVLGMVFRRGMLTALGGLAVGLVAAYGLAGAMKSLVWGVSSGDPATFLGIPLVLAAAAGLAIFIPAHRATRIDPLVALRHD